MSGFPWRYLSRVLVSLCLVTTVQAALVPPSGTTQTPEIEFDSLWTATPTMNEPELTKALDFINRGELDRGLDTVNGYLLTHPLEAPAHEIRGAALALRGDLKGAQEALRRAVSLRPQQSSAWTKLGDVQAALGLSAEALQSYLSAVAQNDAEARAHQRLGVIYQEKGESARAIEHLEKGLIGTPADYVGIKANLAQEYNRLGQYGKAIELLEPVLPVLKGHAVAQVMLANAYVARGVPERAVPLYEAAMAAAPDKPDIRLALAIALRLQGQQDAALVHLDRLIDGGGAPSVAYIQRALVRYAKDDGVAAGQDLQHALQDKALPLPLKMQVADAFKQHGDLARAIDVYKALIAAHPGQLVIRQRLGIVYQLREDEKAGDALYGEMLKKFSKDPMAYLYAGSYQAFLKRYDEAKRIYSQGLSIAPDHEALQQALKHVVERQQAVAQGQS
ncbi:MAG: tetratricopeptide repeat protein [Gammaproteobacteria bacterium]|nr:tetratricopeptide repeat protein [Gammaproteobacteria bacterium]